MWQQQLTWNIKNMSSFRVWAWPWHKKKQIDIFNWAVHWRCWEIKRRDYYCPSLKVCFSLSASLSVLVAPSLLSLSVIVCLCIHYGVFPAFGCTHLTAIDHLWLMIWGSWIFGCLFFLLWIPGAILILIHFVYSTLWSYHCKQVH